ncbi:MAG: SH3 domain-containing protein [Lachnospiraceae bacterium]|nr:SH3 domain-containing protein [Lachnospiraceae bacterium]
MRAKRNKHNLISMIAVLFLCSMAAVVLFPSNAKAASLYSSGSYYEVLATSCLREAPSKESRQIGSVKRGESVLMIRDEGNDFCFVSHNGEEGYIYSGCVDTVAVAAVASVITDSVKEKNSSGNSVMEMSMMLGGSAGKTGAVKKSSDDRNVSGVEVLKAVSAFSTAAMNSDHEVADEPEPEETKDIAEGVLYCTLADVNMRDGAGKSFGWVTAIPEGSAVEVIGNIKDDYCLVKYNGYEGYVMSACLFSRVEDITKAGGRALAFTCTGYCPCEKCCGKFSSEVTGVEQHTATGTIPTAGRTIAVDPNVIPYGTRIEIEGLGSFVAEDCGGMVEGNHIDIYFDTHEEAVAFGRQTRYVVFPE